MQKILFKILDKLGAFEYPKISTITSITVNTKTVFETLMKQAEFSKYDFDQTPKQLIIGSKTFSELIGCEEFRSYISFFAPGEFYDGVWTIRGFKVKIKRKITMKHHSLKLFTKYFQHVVDGNKRSELRHNDRDYQVGDIITLS